MLLRPMLLGLHGVTLGTELDSASSSQSLTSKVYTLVVVFIVEATSTKKRQYHEHEAQFFAHIGYQVSKIRKAVSGLAKIYVG